MLLETSEVHIELIQMLKKRTERSACGHLCESIHILREALATIAELAIRTGDVGVGVVDVAGDYMSLRRMPVALALMTSSKCGVWSAGIPRCWLTFLMIVLISSSVLVSGIPTILMTRTIVFP